MNEVLSGIFGLAGLVFALALAFTWILFPFLILSRLSKQQKTLDEIARHTKSQADFWRDRNVRIE